MLRRGPRRLILWLWGGLALAARVRATFGGPTTKPDARPDDVVVVGAGMAGLSAALEAARAGARVTVVDTWSVFGGHAVMSSGGILAVGTSLQKARGIVDTPEIALRDFIAWGEDPDPVWVRRYIADSAPEVFDWLVRLGVSFESLGFQHGNTVERFHIAQGRGLGLVSALYRACALDPGITFRWNARVTRLVVSGGRVVGVRGASTRTREPFVVRGGAVILATGGYQSNLEMVRAFWPKHLPAPGRILAGSGLSSLGSGLRVAGRAGAALVNTDRMWSYVNGMPDPRYPGAERGVSVFAPAGIYVNQDGARFTNERTSAKFTLPAMLAQRGKSAWLVFDETGKAGFRALGADWARFEVVERVLLTDRRLVKRAPSVAALAEEIDVPPAALGETVRRWNEIVAKGEDRDFQRFTRERPPRIPHGPIDTAPFYAVAVYPIARKSMGGLRIDERCRVLDATGQPIAGLLAAGEVTGVAGINGKASLEGTFLGPSVLMGRIAARTVTAELPRSADRAPAPSVAANARDAKPPRYPGAAVCNSCHGIAVTARLSRPGYLHYERVHRVVLERKHDCAECHAELGAYRPYVPHRIDRVAQIAVCARCHMADEE